jgi:hypothetical protein
MALQSFSGIGIFGGPIYGRAWAQAGATTSNQTMDAVNESLYAIGHMITSDQGSHTIDTSGSSSIGWRAGAVTFANAGSTVKVGIATVDMATGPVGRPVNSSDVITFDVNASFIGGGGGITANAWQTSVPTTGTKTIAHGDLVAICIQFTARGGTDTITSPAANYGNPSIPGLTTFTGTYTGTGLAPNFFITFADGAFGYLLQSDVFNTYSARTWNSGSSPNEYGNLVQFPYPVKISGVWGHNSVTADLDVVLYSDPLGTPVAERTVSVDGNVSSDVSGSRRAHWLFPTPYITRPNQPIVVTLKPATTTNMIVTYKTLADANHRIAEVCGLTGYGVSRTSGAFADANSSLDHYSIGPVLSGFENPVTPIYQAGY